MKKLPLLLFGAATILLSCEAKKNKDINTNTSSAEMMPPADTSASTRTAPEAVANTSGTTENTAESGQKPALNPAHGEPYHRCDIQVGAPLNSPPAAPTPAPQAVQQAPVNSAFNTNPISPSAAPAPPVSSSAATGPKPALNPPHGEPHHRCDLQVGAPLT